MPPSSGPPSPTWIYVKRTNYLKSSRDRNDEFNHLRTLRDYDVVDKCHRISVIVGNGTNADSICDDPFTDAGQCQLESFDRLIDEVSRIGISTVVELVVVGITAVPAMAV